MYVGYELSPLSPGETIDLWWDYAKDFRPAVTEVISSATVTVELVETEAGATADSDPSSRKSGSATVESSDISDRNTVVVQRITGLVAGNKYRFVCRATTDAGQVLELFHRAWCKAAN